MLFANSLAILTLNFPARQRGQALGMSGMLTYTGLTIGPSLGGWLTDSFSWRAVFYINIPVGLIALLLSWRAIPKDSPSEQTPPFDFTGAALFTGGLTSLLLVLDQGHSWGWTSVTVLILSGASAALLSAFFALELRHRHPMLDLTLFRRVNFSAAVASALLNYICINCALFLLPFYLVQGRGLGATQAGIILTAQPIIMAIATPLSGRLSDRLGSRLPATVGMTILAVGLLLLARLSTNSPLAEVTGALAIVGLGTGIFIAPNSSALMGSAPRQRQGIAAGILATARNTGMVLGVGLAGAIFTTALQGTPVTRAGAILFRATSASFLVAGGLAVLGIFVSSVRGK